MIATRNKKYTYNIMDEMGKEFKVEFNDEHQIHTWMTMELNLFNKKYIITGIKTSNV